MYIVSARFVVRFDKHESAIVEFNQVLKTIVILYGKTMRIDNANGHWKPCATHACDLVRLHLRRKPASNQARQRTMKTKPVLRLLSSE